MDSRNQRIYKFSDMNDRYYIFEGMGSLSRLVGSATTIPDLSYILISDYLDIELTKVDFVVKDKLELLLTNEFICRRRRLDNYLICGLTIRECIDERKRSKTV